LHGWPTHTDSRFFGALGLAMAAAALSSIGLARTYPQLLILFTVGMLGVGAFHPIAAATVGGLSGSRRTLGVTLFFTAGMIGSTCGPLLSTRIASIEPDGFGILRWTMIPGLVVSMLLSAAIRHVPHNQPTRDAPNLDDATLSTRWWLALLLFAGNAVRYSVNMAMIYLYVQWSEATVSRDLVNASPESIAREGSLLAGTLHSANMAGMGLGGLLIGSLARRGTEQRWFVLVPTLLAPACLAFRWVDPALAIPLAIFAAIGFAGTIPLSISVAQRLLPHRTSFASSMAMGGAWAMAMTGPLIAEWIIQRSSLDTAFLVAAVALACSGALSLPLRIDGLLRKTS
jgi:FSR family fosmidomycin resistance protein-like MFS transporter